VDRLLELAGVARDQLAAVAAVVGPGSYTGLRVGVAAAQGLAFALQLKAVPLSRLEVLAAGAGPWQGPVLALENARQGRWFRQWFGATREGLSPLGEAACLDGPRLAAEVSGHLQEGPLLVGPEADRCLPAGMEGVAVWPQDGSPHVWCALAWRRWEEGRAVEPVALAPVYLRPPT
jgi:tRNA threonylcarbamoyladenosine biosynthesis protein TsaB